MRYLLAVISATLLTLTQSILAQSSIPPAGEISETEPKKNGDEIEIIVTATRTETDADKTASSVTVIDREQIEAHQYRHVQEALRSVPGLYLATNGAPGQLTGVFIRGTRTPHNTVMIDGRRLPSS